VETEGLVLRAEHTKLRPALYRPGNSNEHTHARSRARVGARARASARYEWRARGSSARIYGALRRRMELYLCSTTAATYRCARVCLDGTVDELSDARFLELCESRRSRKRERERERERIIGQREHFVSRSTSESARDNCSLLLPFPLFPRFRSTTERETEAIHSIWRDKQNLIRAEAERRGQLQRVKVWH